MESCLSREIQAEEGETKDFELAYQQMINIYQLYFIVLLMVGASDVYDVLKTHKVKPVGCIAGGSDAGASV